MPRDVTGTAQHEAAHAVVAHTMGATVVRIELLQTEDYGGRCIFALPHRGPPQDRWWACAVATVAGNRADRRAGREDPGSLCDLRAAQNAAAAIISTGVPPTGVRVDLTFDALLTAACARADEILAEHDELLHAVVQRLTANPDQPWEAPDLTALAASTAGAPERHVAGAEVC